MKTLLLQVVLLGLRVGQWHLYAPSDRILTARRDYSSRQAPRYPASVDGLARLLQWIDKQNLKPHRADRY